MDSSSSAPRVAAAAAATASAPAPAPLDDLMEPHELISDPMMSSTVMDEVLQNLFSQQQQTQHTQQQGALLEALKGLIAQHNKGNF